MAHSTTFSALLAEIKAYCDHDETEFSAQLDNIIARGQDRVQAALDLDIFRTEEAKTLTASTSTIDISGDDWLVVSDAWISATGAPIVPRSPAYVRMYSGSGAPLYYCRTDEDTITLAPSPTTDTALKFEVQVRQPVLNGSNETNWFTKHAAAPLLYSCLVEAEMFLVDPSRKQEFEQMYAAAIRQVQVELRASGMKRGQFNDAIGIPPTAGAPA